MPATANPGCLLFPGDPECCEPPPIFPFVESRTYRRVGNDGDGQVTTDVVTYPNARACSGLFAGWQFNNTWVTNEVGTAQTTAETDINSNLTSSPCTSEGNWDPGLQPLSDEVRNLAFPADPCKVLQMLPHAGFMTEWTWHAVPVELGQGAGQIPFALDDDGTRVQANVIYTANMTGIFVPLTAGQSLSSVHSVNDIVIRMRYSNQLNAIDSTWDGEYREKFATEWDCTTGPFYQLNNTCTEGTLPAPGEAVQLWYGSAANVGLCFQDVIDGGAASLMTQDHSFTPARTVSTVNSHTSTAWATHALQSGHTVTALILAAATKCKSAVDTITAIAPTRSGTERQVFQQRIMASNTVQSFIDLDFRDSTPSSLQLFVPGGG